MGNIEERTAIMNNLKKNSERNIANRTESEIRAGINAIEKRYIKENRKKNMDSINYKNDNRHKNMKNSPKKQKQDFRAVGKKLGFVALFSAGVLTGHFGPKIPDALDDYKKDAYERVLENVKKEIGKDNGNISTDEIKVWDKGGQMSSSTDKADIQVEISGKTYRYRADIDGTITVFEDTIKNDDIVKAISIVSGAQGGNLVDAVRANHLSDQIEEGKKDYTIEQTKEKEDMEER